MSEAARRRSLSERCEEEAPRTMPNRIRKLVGGLVLFVLVMAYALVAMVLGDMTVRHAPWYVQLPFFAVLGLIWVVPAAVLIRYMQAPDRS
jgi:hypothetical protein